jgi:hypothetical protein
MILIQAPIGRDEQVLTNLKAQYTAKVSTDHPKGSEPEEIRHQDHVPKVLRQILGEADEGFAFEAGHRHEGMSDTGGLGNLAGQRERSQYRYPSTVAVFEVVVGEAADYFEAEFRMGIQVLHDDLGSFAST